MSHLGAACAAPARTAAAEDVAPGDSPCMTMRWFAAAKQRPDLTRCDHQIRHDDLRWQPADVLDADRRVPVEDRCMTTTSIPWPILCSRATLG